jgi:transcriptional regulator with XRE-family HTH domain
MDEIRFSEFSLETAALIGGRRLRELRERLGLTLRAVEDSSNLLAQSYSNPEFSIPPSRLSDIETKGILPSIYRVHALSLIYKVGWEDILSWYAITVDYGGAEVQLPGAPKTHVITKLPAARDKVTIPAKLDPAFDPRKSVDFGRFIEQWGSFPMKFVSEIVRNQYTYGYIGTEDYTMYPVLPPGSFVQVDPSKNRVRKGLWHSDYERPIYFVETREDYLCSWCSIKDNKVILQPHPMSPCEVRIMKFPQEAEVIGQVIGAAIRLCDFLPPAL